MDGCCDDDEDVVYESEMRSQVRESLGNLSKLECVPNIRARGRSGRMNGIMRDLERTGNHSL